ncbi:MAG: HPr family phosphocarrier protein [Kiritimatiellae bacterium]|nr:HPr family phosphocarrier protein [Kiritimatiellia bacterium]NLE40706.1 HPr family phosphocarrier protein [Lentisphaerota bacterium]
MTLTKEIPLVNKYGMHVRPAGALARVCQKYMSEVTVANGDCSVSGKSVLGLMTLQAPVGTVLKFTAQGDDASLVLAEIEELINNRFGIADE